MARGTVFESAPTRRRWGLFAFWAVILGGGALGCAYLQYLGPPPPDYFDSGVPVKAGPPSPPGQKPVPQQAAAPTPAALPKAAPAAAPGPKAGGVAPTNAGFQVPADRGSLPPDAPRVAVRVAVVVAGLGDDPRLDQLAAWLPAQIALALSPYGAAVAQAADEARAHGHETLLLLPMPGLLAAAPMRQNESTLAWSMARFQGYEGVTDAFGPAMGGGFMIDPAAKAWLMGSVARRGLYYIEGDPGAPPLLYAAGRRADIVVDGAYGPAAEASQLGALVSAAQARHAALAVLLHPTPAALRTLNEWSAALEGQDILLVPVSALVQPPEVPLPLYASSKP